MTKSYNDLADAAERGELAPIPGTRLTGAAAAEAGRAALMEATGAATIEDASRLALGRPRLGDERGPSRQFRVRTTDEMYTAVERVADSDGRRVSEVVREAIAEYLTRHTPTGRAGTKV